MLLLLLLLMCRDVGGKSCITEADFAQNKHKTWRKRTKLRTRIENSTTQISNFSVKVRPEVEICHIRRMRNSQPSRRKWLKMLSYFQM